MLYGGKKQHRARIANGLVTPAPLPASDEREIRYVQQFRADHTDQPRQLI
jgi:hypothetical protein